MKELPSIEFKKGFINPLKIEVIPFNTLENIYKRPLDHNPFQAHKLKFNAILIITDGEEGKHNIDFENYTYKKHSFVLVSKEQAHAFVDLPSSNDGVLLVFTEELFLEVGSSFPPLINHLYNSQLYFPVLNIEDEKFEELYAIVTKIKKELGEKSKSKRIEIVKSYLKILLLELFYLREKENNLSEKSPYLEDFIKFQQALREHIHEEKKVKFYAKELNVTSKQLNVITKTTIGVSAKDFIVNFVILEAKKYLKCSDLTSKEVAYKLGFDEPTNFTKFFKKHTQMLPKEFAQSN